VLRLTARQESVRRGEVFVWPAMLGGSFAIVKIRSG